MEIKSYAGMNILILSPTPTYPEDFGNRKRVFAVCKELQDQGANIHFLYYPSESDWRDSLPDADIHRLQRQWSSFTIVPPTRELHTNSVGDDHLIDEWWDPSIENSLKWIFKSKKFDAFIVNYTWLSKALEFAPTETLKVLDTHDKFSARRELLEINGINKEFFHTTEEQEVIALERADLVWAIKDQEKEFFKSLTKKPKIETLIHCDHDQYAVKNKDWNTIDHLRVGIMGARNNINVINTKKYLESALPVCQSAFAPIKFVLGGTMCYDLKYEDDEWIENIGYVEHVDEFYNQVDLVIIPMVFSSGLKIKVAEALARSIPLLCHEHASEGYPIVTRDHSLKTLDDLTERLIELSFEPGQLDWLANMSVKAFSQCQTVFNKTLYNCSKYIRRKSVVSTVVIKAKDLTSNNLRSLRLRELLDFLPYTSKTVVLILGEGGEPKITTILRRQSSVYFVTENAVNSYIQYWDPDLLWALAGVENLKIPHDCELFIDEIASDAHKFDNLDVKKCLITPNLFTDNNFSKYHSVISHPIFNWRLSEDFLPKFSHYHNGGKIVIYDDGSIFIKQVIKILGNVYPVGDIVLVSESVSKGLNKYLTLIVEDILTNLKLLPKNISLFVCRNDVLPSWLSEFLARSDCHILRLNNYNSIIDIIDKVIEFLEKDHGRYESDDMYACDAGWAYLWNKFEIEFKQKHKLRYLIATEGINKV